MNIIPWTILAAVLYPYVWFGVASGHRKKEFGDLDSHYPRAQEAKLTGVGARAQGASNNAFEALAVYAPAALLAHVSAPQSSLAPLLAIGWVVVRGLHGVVYIADKPPLRTLLFALGVVASIGLVLVGARVL